MSKPKLTRADVFAYQLQRSQRAFIIGGVLMLAVVWYLTGEWSPLP